MCSAAVDSQNRAMWSPATTGGTGFVSGGRVETFGEVWRNDKETVWCRLKRSGGYPTGSCRKELELYSRKTVTRTLPVEIWELQEAPHELGVWLRRFPDRMLKVSSASV